MTTTEKDRLWLAPLFIPLLALWLFFLRFGYGYGASDQGELLPAVLHGLNEYLYTADWFVQTQGETIGVRYFVVTLLEMMAQLMPLWLATGLLYVTAWLATAYAVYAIAHLCTGRALASALAVGAGLVLTPNAILGGNALVSWMFTPSMAAWALALWGVFFYLRGRFVWTALFFGVATWMQALIGLQMAGLAGLVMLTRPGDRRRNTAHFAAAYLLSAAPLLAPVVFQQLTELAGSRGAPSLFYIIAEFRNPHHYLFFSFDDESYLQFGGAALLGGLSYAYLHRRRDLLHASFFSKSWAAIAGLCTIGFIFSEVYPVLFNTKLQLFKYTVFAKLLFVIAVCGAVFSWLPDAVRDRLMRLYAARRAWLGVMALVWTLTVMGAVTGAAGLQSRLHPIVHKETPVAAVERWARSESPVGAVFAVPPSWSGFRTRARRAIVVDFKSFPFQPQLTRAWYERLMDIAPLRRQGDGVVAALDGLDSSYAAQPPGRWRLWQQRYHVDYVISQKTPDTVPFGNVFSSPPWMIYRVSSERL